MYTNVLPASGKLVGIQGFGNSLKVRNKLDGVTFIPLPTTEEFLMSVNMDIETVSSITLFIDLTLNLLTAFYVKPIFAIPGLPPFYPRSWLYPTANNRFEADALLEYRVTSSGLYLVSFPTWGMKYLNIVINAIGADNTDSGANIWIVRNWCQFNNITQLPN